jgi:hypothetical protein
VAEEAGSREATTADEAIAEAVDAVAAAAEAEEGVNERRSSRVWKSPTRRDDGTTKVSLLQEGDQRLIFGRNIGFYALENALMP